MYTVEVYTVEMYAVEMYTVEMYASEMHVFEMCMPLKCMSLRSMSLDQSTKLSSVWIFPFHNVAKSLSKICQQWPGVEQARKERRKGFLSSASANNVKRAHFSNPLQNVYSSDPLTHPNCCARLKKCGRNACTDTVTPLTFRPICQKLVHPKLNLLTTNLNTHSKSKAYMDI